MDFFPSVFSQNDLFWLDNLMPVSNKATKDKKKSKKNKDLAIDDEVRILWFNFVSTESDSD